jgi:CubicO group peptidase (beta-lactamase class C family)
MLSAHQMRFGFLTPVLAACLSISAAAQPARGTAPDALTPAEVEQWADEVFGQILDNHRVSVLAVSVVQGDRTLLTRGYGYADWAERSPVIPDETQFRIASITKTFTATAVAQLLERGLIKSLDDPANMYLKRTQLAQSFGEDVTVWDLLTHRAGYEDSSLGRGEFGHELPLVPEVIAAATPQIVRKRDTVSVYSNFSVSILGIMIEDITGQLMEDYLRENIFQPLGMTNSLLMDGPERAPNLVTPYNFTEDGSPVVMPWRQLNAFIAPAGSMKSTPADMAKYMIAHIQAGRGADNPILSSETFDLMHQRHEGNHPRQSGFGMIFMAYDYNGESVIEHYGNTGDYRALTLMLLNRGIGVTTMFAGGGPADADAQADPALPPVTGAVKAGLSHSGLRALVLEHFLGPLEAPETVLPTEAGDYAGAYLSNRRNYTGAEAAEDGRNPTLVEDAGGGALTIAGLGPYRQREPDIFFLDGTLPLEAPFPVSNQYAFVRGPDGEVTAMFSHVNTFAYEKMIDLP